MNRIEGSLDHVFANAHVRQVKWRTVGCVALILLLAAAASAQKDDEGPTSVVSILVIKDDNGKPVRNAAVIMHPVSAAGKQSRGGLELKTDNDGKTSFDGIPYGTLRVQVLASGFQTFGEDYDIEKAKLDLTIKLKRPQSQYSIYQDHPEERNNDKNSNQNNDKKDQPPPDPNAKPQ
jgi:Carboxypeptidase regulatory-like domain